MIWPGTGSQVVFEFYKGNKKFIRILWGGVVLRSSSPTLGLVDLRPVDTLLGYFDELAGMGAAKLPELYTVS